MRQISFRSYLQHDLFFFFFTIIAYRLSAKLFYMSRFMTKPTKWRVRPAKGHPPSLIRVFSVRMKKAWVLSYPLSAQRRL